MTADEIKKLKRDTERKITELLEDFTDKTGFYIDDMHVYYTEFENTTTSDGDTDMVFSDIHVKFDIKL